MDVNTLFFDKLLCFMIEADFHFFMFDHKCTKVVILNLLGSQNDQQIYGFFKYS